MKLKNKILISGISTLSILGASTIAINSFNAYNVEEKQLNKSVKSTSDSLAMTKLTTMEELEVYIPNITEGTPVKITDMAYIGATVESQPRAKFLPIPIDDAANSTNFKIEPASNSYGNFKFNLNNNYMRSNQASRLYANARTNEQGDVVEIWLRGNELLFIPKVGNTSEPSFGLYYDVRETTSTDDLNAGLQVHSADFPSDTILDTWEFKVTLNTQPVIKGDPISTAENAIAFDLLQPQIHYNPALQTNTFNVFVDGVMAEEITFTEPGVYDVFEVTNNLIDRSLEQEIKLEFGPYFNDITFKTIPTVAGVLSDVSSGGDFVVVKLQDSDIGSAVKSFDLQYKRSTEFVWESSHTQEIDENDDINGNYRVSGLEKETTYDFRIKYSDALEGEVVSTNTVTKATQEIKHDDPGVINPTLIDVTFNTFEFGVSLFDPSTSSVPISFSEIMIRNVNENNGDWQMYEQIISSGTNPEEINKNHLVEGLSDGQNYDVKIIHYSLDEDTNNKDLVSETATTTFRTIEKPKFNSGFIIEESVDYQSINVNLTGYEEVPGLIPVKAEFQYTENDNFDTYSTGNILYANDIVDGTYQVNNPNIPLKHGTTYNIRLAYYDAQNNLLGETTSISSKTADGIEYDVGSIDIRNVESNSVTFNLSGFKNGGDGIRSFATARAKYKKSENESFIATEIIHLNTTDPNKDYVVNNLQAEINYDFVLEYYYDDGSFGASTEIKTTETADSPDAPIRGEVVISGVEKDSLNVTISNFRQGVGQYILDNVSIQVSSNGVDWQEKKSITDMNAVNGTHNISGLGINKKYDIKVVYRKGTTVIRETREPLEIKTKTRKWGLIGGIIAGGVVLAGLATFGVVHLVKTNRRKKFF